MAVVYVSGPYSAPDATGVAVNKRAAAQWATRLAEAGLAPICPHTNVEDAGCLTYEEIMGVDFVLLSRCEAVFLMPGWEASPGAVRERDYALGHGTLVFEDFEALVEAFTLHRQRIERVA